MEEHQSIVKAIRTGDETNVTEAVLNHLDTTRKAIEMETAKERLSSKRKKQQRGEKLARSSRK
jgi:DNA-binding FadR family transcriptional regulator